MYLTAGERSSGEQLGEKVGSILNITSERLKPAEESFLRESSTRIPKRQDLD